MKNLSLPTKLHKDDLYLQEGVNSLFILSIHIVLRKQLEVWHKSIAWSNVPVMERGQFFNKDASKRFVMDVSPKLSVRQ